MTFFFTRTSMLVLMVTTALGASAETIATVNGKVIPNTRLEALEYNQRAMRKGAKPLSKAELVEALSDLELASQEAEKLGLSSTELFQNRLVLSRQGLMTQELVLHLMLKNSPSEADIQVEFEKSRGISFRPRHKLHRITVKNEDTAIQAIARIKSGESFNDVAKQLSIDSDQPQGGDAGWHSESTMPDSINKIMSTLKPGQMTEIPVKSSLGFHVVRLDEVGTEKVAPTTNEKRAIAEALATRLVENYLKDLRAKAVIK